MAKIPKTIGGIEATWDRLYRKRKALEAQVAELKKREDELAAAALAILNEQRVDRAGRIRRAVDEVPTVEDWGQLYSFIASNEAFDLLQRRVASTAVRDRWAEGVEVPGITKTVIVRAKMSSRGRGG